MPVTAAWFGKSLQGQWGTTAANRIDWDADTIKVSLHASTYSPDVDAHDYWNDTSGETSGTGYTTGGLSITTSAVAIDTANNEVELDATDASWTSSTFSTAKAVVYKDAAGDSTTDPLMSYVDFGGTESVSSGTFTLQFDASGVMKITY